MFNSTLLAKCSIIILFCLCTSAQQTSGTIRGTVTDPDGAVIQNATLRVSDIDKQQTVRQLATDARGEYAISLEPGQYSLSVEAAGFAPETKTAIKVDANGERSILFQLSIHPVTEVDRIESLPVQVDTNSPTALGVFGETQITSLPTNNRNYEEFVTFAAPGISSGTSDKLYVGVHDPSGLANQVNFSINGGRPTQNNWTLDGIDNVDRGLNLTLLDYPSIEAITEFTVLRSQYNPEYGRSSSGQINVITRSGSRSFHGSLYEFFRNDHLDANNFFNNMSGIRRPPLRDNDFGWTLGGPLLVPKLHSSREPHTFFFFSQEFRRVIEYADFTSGDMPTAAELRGIFPSPVCLNVDCSSVGTRVTNITPTAQAYITDIYSKFPALPSQGAPLYRFASRNVDNFRQEIIRLDHYFGSKVQAAARYVTDAIPTEEPSGLFSASNLPGVANTKTNSPGHNLLLKATIILNPQTLDEVGFAHSYGAVISTPTGLDVQANSPDVRPSLPFATTLGRIPTLAFRAGEPIGGFGPYSDYNRNLTAFNTFSWSHGPHYLKIGGTYIFYVKDENNAGNNVGTYYFNAIGPRSNSSFQQEFANFLQGTVLQFTQVNVDGRSVIHQNQLDLFAQDAWRIRPNLTVSYGVRYSLFFQPTDARGHLANFDPALYNAASAPRIDPRSGLLVPGTPTPVLDGVSINGQASPYGNAVARTPKLDLAPRVGLTWDPSREGKTSLRMGYGIFYDSPATHLVQENVFNNPPFIQTISIVNTNLDNPGSAGPTLAPAALYALQANWKQPYVQQWSFGIQRQVLRTAIIDVGYYASKGTHLLGVIDVNQAYPNVYRRAGITTPPVTAGVKTQLLNAVRPYSGFDAINMSSARFNSNYNSLQAHIAKQFRDGSIATVNYTWSHALTDAQSDTATPQNSYNIAGDYGPTAFDRRQILTGNWVYTLPFFRRARGFLPVLLGRWQWNGTVLAQTGLPFTITGASVDAAGLGILDPQSLARARPDMVGNPNTSATHTITNWFNTSAFANVPASAGRPGNSPVGAVRGPGMQRWNTGFSKRLTLYEHLSLQIRAEAFNVFNHTNLGTINTNIQSSVFGQVVSARDGRNIQLGMKLLF